MKNGGSRRAATRKERALKQSDLRIVIATDGSPSARAALVTAGALPWPRKTRVRGVVVSPFDWLTPTRSREARRALTEAFRQVAEKAQRAIARRWPDSDVSRAGGSPADAIVGEAHEFRADVIVVGWRGHGRFRRLLVGSVSRSVVENAPRAVLVVRRLVREIRRIVIGIDGSPNAARTVDFVRRHLRPGRAAVTVVRIVEPKTVPTAGRLPASIKAIVLSELAAVNRRMLRDAHRDVDSATVRLKRGGWTARGEVWTGAPLAGLLEVVERKDADLLIVGARAKRGVERALLGSVAAGALDRSPVPVLVVR